MFWQGLSDGADDRTFLIADGRRYSYNDVFELGDALFSKADRAIVLILCDRSPEAVAAYLGALRKGLVPMLVDGELTRHSLERTIGAYTPRYIVAPAEMTLEDYAPNGRLGTKALFERSSLVNTSLHQDLALLIPTSGSTGDPKCVRLTANNIDACTRSIVEYLGMTGERITVSLLPFHYSYGLSVLHNTIFARACMVLTDKSILDRSIWQMIEEERVTDLAGVPFTFETLRRIRLSEACLGNLVCVTQAGGRLAPELTRHFWQYFADHGVRYFTMYGQTEAAPRISYVPPGQAMEKLGSVGIPVPGGRALIAETGEAIGEGELLYVGPNVSMGYASSAQDLEKGDEFQGKLYTGDYAKIDKDGFITIVGRKKRFIKLHGISVNLDHAESVLKSGGLDCIVIGAENRLIVCIGEPDAERAQMALKDNFNFHPSVARVVVSETLPLTSAGKPDYVTLSERFL
ncbi:AMP-binding protein [Rhizobium leguminosarum]|uniref:AMP-binding protein n=1 Tax=Rhizobium leguminosarum TaxID=384 RepID=UPI00103CB3B9|nr:AMP-binding protein [Rhizobium leguminosarum]TBZ80791.1 2-succinylbenzoate--CoA ligase [Rhizobium leguminosarum bv. viciae]